ncbi:MAG TPA: hypothetical protein VKU36_01150 [Candidatus Babeliales bacterium]|nr:hypothetical protein [Candidatus Babeliales bacterium]
MIKKTLLLILSFCGIDAMENNIEWVVKYQKTKIHLTTESLYDICDKVNIAIVGHHQQDLLFQTHPDDPRCTGNFYIRFFIYKTKDIQKRKDQGMCITVMEPCLKKNSYLNKHQQLAKRCEYVSLKDQALYTDDALDVASQDLTTCYYNALSFIINTHVIKEYSSYAKYQPHPNPKSIALPTLSTTTGFPFDDAAPIAIKTVVNFIKAQPECYDDIYLSVDDMMQFNTYKKLLLKRTGSWDKMLLFYLIYKKGNNILSFLPHDVIKLILQLI